MELTDIAQIIKQFVRKELAPDCEEAQLDSQHSLLESGILDSFGIMVLLSFIEEKFHVKISADKIEPANFENLAAISELVARSLKS